MTFGAGCGLLGPRERPPVFDAGMVAYDAAAVGTPTGADAAPAGDAATADAVDAGSTATPCPAGVAAGTVPGGFTDLTTPVEAQLPAVPSTGGVGLLSLATMGDVDGDGATDVLFGQQGAPAGSRGFRYDAATGSLVPLDGPWLAVSARGIADLDGDGRDDVVGTGEGAGTGMPPVLWGGADAYAPLLATTEGLGVTAMWFDDVDRDGWLDVLVGADLTPACGDQPTVRAFLQTAPRRFEERPAMVPSAVRVGEGALFTGALAGRRVIGAVGEADICGADAPVFFAEGAPDAERYPTFAPVDLLGEQIGGPMGAALADLDDDGRAELTVSSDPRLRLWRGAEGALRPVPNAGGMSLLLGSLGQPMKPWAVAFLDLDQDGRRDAVTTHGNHNPLPTEVPIGPQWTTVHLHGDGDFCMSEVDGAFGLDRGGDWRSLAVADLDADGDPDLAVGGRLLAPRVYRNDLRTGRHGLALRLRGTTGNALGVGAWVEVRATATSPVQHHLVGGVASPGVFATPLVFAGLGDATAAAEVTVRWPSGTVQTLRDLAAGQTHLVVEPPSLAVDPPSRRAPADGASVVRVRVTPRGPDGGVDAAARVTFRLAAGGGALGAPAVAATGETSVEVTAPAARGSSVLEVSVDGRPMGVRPRLWWE